MLFDLYTSLTTRCSPHIRALGYVDETIAMRKRHRGRSAAWQQHLENTKRFVYEGRLYPYDVVGPAEQPNGE